MTNKPEAKFRSGTVCATVWKNQIEKDGEKRSFSSVSFEKSYKDKDGEWKTTNSLNASDLPRAILVLSKAYEHVALRDKAEDELMTLAAMQVTEEAV